MTLKRAKYRAIGAAILALAASTAALQAQEVVQPLPPSGSSELADALQRLARNGDDVSGLIDAGDASLKLGDVAAAIGFFGRAQAIAPDNPRISLGLARAYTLSRRPVEALRLFAEAERGGIALSTMAADRALAFDLVGDSASAQEFYRLAIANGADDAARRNLALSQAIAGNRQGFEATLLPLLEKGDLAAFRTRSFGLAILGETEAAVQIAREMMSKPMADRIEPYLRYMTQLTPAQQAAAGALGVFPHAAAIGRDDRQIATYASSGDRQVRNADRSLAPSGPPLGSQETQPARTQSRAEQRRQERQARIETAQRAEAEKIELPAIPSAEELPPIRRADASPAIETARQPSRTVPPPAVSTPPRESLEEAFAAFTLAETRSTAPRAGAVDIRKIEVPRETSTPPPPQHPARHWVQLATGRDIDALGFDWRRISRNVEGALAGKSAFTAPWGEANRLLAGPYSSAAEAREVVARLKAAGQDSFAFSSAAGEAVFALAGANAAPEAAKPVHPSRHWVQVATGRDLSALGFDWRRIVRRSEGALDSKGPFTVKWGEANRLLAGPYESTDAARAMVARLKALGIDSFVFTSEKGQAIDPLD